MVTPGVFDYAVTALIGETGIAGADAGAAGSGSLKF